jgi:hypothetical protein
MIEAMLLIIVRTFLAALLLASAAHKFMALDQFRLAVTDYDVLPRQMIGAVTWGLPLAELIIGAALLWQPFHLWAGVAAAMMFALYAVVMLVNLVRGRRDIECGCSFGSGRTVSYALPFRNAGLAALAMVVAMIGVTVDIGVFAHVNAAACGVVMFLIYAGLDVLAANAQRIKAGGLRP